MSTSLSHIPNVLISEDSVPKHVRDRIIVVTEVEYSILFYVDLTKCLQLDFLQTTVYFDLQFWKSRVLVESCYVTRWQMV